MDYAEELYKYFMEANEAEAEPEPKEVKVPASARTVFVWRDPKRKMSEDVTLEVRATKARWFVWRFGAWKVVTESEARAIIKDGEAAKERRLAEMARAWKVKEFVSHCRSVRNKRQAQIDRDALLASIEEAALRMTLKAKTLEERMAINDEKERLEREVHEVYGDIDFEDEWLDFSDYEAPELPEAWRIVAANPSRAQYNLKF